MDSEKQEFVVLAENLRRLRQARNLSQAALAEQAGLSRVGYRNIETGRAIPKADTFARLASALGVGLDDLVRPVRRLSSVRFRARKKLASREALLADVGKWIDDYVFIEELCRDAAPFKFEDVAKKLRRYRRSDDLPARAARLARDAILNQQETIRDISGLLEDNGIKVFTPQIASDQFFGLSVASQDGGPAIVVNTWERITVERWIFTAAHELGHLLLHQDAYDVQRTEESEAEEREADQFASHFLMPDEVFQKEWNEAKGLASIDAVFKLKSIFRVSWKTVVYRLASERDDPRRVWAQFYSGYKRRYGKSLKAAEEPNGLIPGDFQSPSPALRIAEEPEHLGASVFQEDRLSRLVRQAVDQDLISLSRAAEVLGLSTVEMRQLANSWLE